MVACPCYRVFIDFRHFISGWRRQCTCAIYLLFILKSMKNRTKSLETALVITAALLIFYFFNQKTWLLKSALGLALIAIFLPKIMIWIHEIWMKLAALLGLINGKVLLSILFFVILTPLAWLSRLFGKNSLQLKPKPQNESYYVERNHTFTKEDLEQLF
jgi:Saxitoxin biosynthesis operon protein SxtJ